MSDTNINITLTLPVSEELCRDIMCTAYEGGINYWVQEARNTVRGGERDPLDYLSFEVLAEDDQADLESNWKKIDSSVIRDGITRLLTKAVDVRSDIREAVLTGVLTADGGGNIDAEVADCIVQAGVFNELVYG